MATQKCSYWNCSNHLVKNKYLTFFSFPNDLERIPIWKENCGNVEIMTYTWDELKRLVVCEEHFLEKHIILTNRKSKRLAKTAVPIHWNDKISEKINMSSHEEEIRILEPKRDETIFYRAMAPSPTHQKNENISPQVEIMIFDKQRELSAYDNEENAQENVSISDSEQSILENIPNKNEDNINFEYQLIEEVSVVNCCRSCMENNCPLTSIDFLNDDDISFHDMLKFCVDDIDWYKEGLSTVICEQCISNLQVAYNFKKICLSTNETFKKYLFLQNEELSSEKNDKHPEKIDKQAELLTKNKKHNLNAESEELTMIKKRLDEYDVSKTFRLSSTPDFNAEQNVEDDEENICPRNAETSMETYDLRMEEKFILENNNPNNKRLVDAHSQDILTPVNEDDQCENGAINNLSSISATKVGNTNSSNTSNERISEHIVNIDTFLLKEDLISGNSKKMEGAVDETNQQNKTEGGNEVSDIEMITPDDPDNVDGQLYNKKSNESQKKGNSRKKVHECKTCGKIYKKNATLMVHNRTHTGEKPFECQYCERRFHHSSHLKEHIRRHKGDKPFLCDLCNKRFTIKGELTMHIKSHTGEKKYQCSSCERRCLTASDLKVHIRTHTGEKPYECQTCGKHFASAYILTVHTKTHTGERPFLCTVCKKTFIQASHLKVHMHQHTGEKFYCKLCSEIFIHSSQLRAHIKKVHKGDEIKRHKCTLCVKLFQFPKELEIHIKKHMGEKYSCTVCEKQFATPSYLNEHNRIHTGESLYSCTVCDKTFTRNQYLIKHFRTHTGEKPFSCKICGKSFTQSSSIKIHMRSHTGERPYPCPLCEKRFITRSDMNVHLRTHKKQSSGKTCSNSSSIGSDFEHP